MGPNLCLHFGADEHPCTTYSDVHQGYRVISVTGMGFQFAEPEQGPKKRCHTEDGRIPLRTRLASINIGSQTEVATDLN